eukprot:SAG11_NODE_3204_length_2613_cov_2.367940_1_plen_128_part_00
MGQFMTCLNGKPGPAAAGSVTGFGSERKAFRGMPQEVRQGCARTAPAAKDKRQVLSWAQTCTMSDDCGGPHICANDPFRLHAVTASIHSACMAPDRSSSWRVAASPVQGYRTHGRIMLREVLSNVVT